MKLLAGAKPSSQRGIVLVITVISMLVLLGMVGLALDLGNAYVNKTRLQNAVDAAALSGAKTLLQTGKINTAQDDAFTTYTFNKNSPGNANLPTIDRYQDIAFATTLLGSPPSFKTFAAGQTPAPGEAYFFVRVTARLNLVPWFLQALGTNEIALSATAVAGPKPAGENCNLLPVLACAEVNSTINPATNTYDPKDTNCADDSHALKPQSGKNGDPDLNTPDWSKKDSINDCFGYNIGQGVVLKQGSDLTSGIGPGNFHLLDFGGSSPEIRENLAGKYTGCANAGKEVEIDTKTGNNAGPTAQGVNTRFGEYQGGDTNPTLYPPDLVIKAGPGSTPDNNPDSYQTYLDDYANESWDGLDGAPRRRVVAVPIVDCVHPVPQANGKTSVTVKAIGCFFLTQKMETSGKQRLYGTFQQQCEISGSDSPNPGPEPKNGFGWFILQLYKDPGSGDS